MHRGEPGAGAAREFGLPIVTSAITHGLMLAGDLFVDPGDVIVLPDKLWGNYRLTYEVRLGARILTHPFFSGDGFDTAGFANAIAQAAPGPREGDRAAELPEQPDRLHAHGGGEPIDRGHAVAPRPERGTKMVALLDDAYFGLFYHLGRESATESLFARLVNRAPEPARGPARWRHQGAVRVGAALRLHHVRARAAPRAPPRCARCSRRR